MTCFRSVFLACLFTFLPPLVFAQAGEQTLFTFQMPEIPDVSDGVPYELGTKFQSARAGQITALRYWKAASDAGTHTGTLWSSNGAALAQVIFSGETSSGWQQQALTSPLAIQPNTTYVTSVNANNYFAITHN